MTSIKTRFAPSPTGYLHIGGLRTALYNYLFAKNTNGNFVLRIEDTDRSRYVEDAEKQIINTLNTFGLNFENDPIYQSSRLPIYKKYVNELIEKGLAYYCFCSKERLDEVRKNQEENKQVPKYDRHCLNLSKEEIEKKLANDEEYVIRMKLPENEIVEFEDLVYGKIKINTNDLDDQVLLKSDGFPTYHMAVVVDDHEMEITHIIRGEEWLPSTPKHVLLYKMFGWETPKFCHLPLLLNPDRSKLSKRQGDVAAEDFLKKGYLPQAILNYVAFLGWNPKTTKEIYSLEELIKDFSIENINKAGAVFDINKLNWINAEYIRNIVANKNSEKGNYNYIINKSKEFLPQNLEEQKIEDIIKVFSGRLNSISEIKDLSNFVFDLPTYDPEMLIFKKSDKETSIKGLNIILNELENIDNSNWNQEFLDTTLKNLTSDNNLTPGDTFWPTRVALSGLEKSPSPAEILWLLGKEESASRIKMAIAKINV